MAALGDLMRREFDAILLDGPEESGKTTTLAQFALAHDIRSLCLFLRPVTEFTYDPVRIRYDICNQISWHLYGKPYTGDEQPDGSHLRSLLRRLEQKSRADRRPYYFIVDGLADIPAQATGVRKAIIDALPLGAPAFRFLIAGSLESTGLSSYSRLNNRVQLITPIGLDEASRLFGTYLTATQTEEIYKTCNGNIGRLASVRRLLSSGVSAEDILGADPVHAHEIFDIEWNRIRRTDPGVEVVLQCVAHTPEIATLQVLAAQAKCDQEAIRSLVGSISCLKIDERNDKVTFVSETFRKYAVRQLRESERSTLGSAVEYLRSRGSLEEAFRTVPEYLERQGDINALVAYFDTQTLASALTNSKSIAFVLERLTRAARIAYDHERREAGARYIVQAAALREVLATRGDRPWVEAALDLYGESAALELASRAFTDEKRLHLLALIARKQRSRGVPLDAQRHDEISRLAEGIDWSQLRDQALKTATELLPVLPDVGLKILEKGLGREGDANALDAAIAGSFLRAALKRDAGSYRRELLERGFEKSQSQAYKGVLASMTGAASAETATELLRDLDRVPNTSERVALIRRWLALHRGHKDSLEIAGKLLDVVMNDSQYAPNASVFVEAVAAVSNMPVPASEAGRITQIVEAQLPQLKPISATVDFVRLLCELTVAKVVAGASDPGRYLFEDAVELKEHEDHASRAAGFAWMVSACLRIKGIMPAADDWGVLAHSESELSRAADLVISSTAEQRDALRSLIEPLAKERLAYLESLIERVNTVERRDELYEDLCLYLLKKTEFDRNQIQSVAKVRRIAARIVDLVTRYGIAESLITAVAGSIRNGGLSASYASDLMPELSVVAGLQERSLAFASMYRALGATERELPENKILLTLGEGVWNIIPDAADQISCAFLLASRLHSADPAMAKKYYENGARLAGTPPGRLARAGYAMRLIVMLYARALAAIERTNGATDADWERFWALARQLSSKGEYSLVAAFAALQVAKTKTEVASEIVEKHVKPPLRQFLLETSEAPTDADGYVVRAAPALWLHHSASIDEFLGSRSREARESALYAIAEHLIGGRIPGEPWNETGRRHKAMTFEVASEVVQVLGKVGADHSFALIIEHLATALKDKDVPARINSNQRTELLRQIRAMSERVLPESRYGIAHDGFLILVKARLLAIDGVRDHAGWEEILRQALSIPNAADRVFVLSELVELTPSGYNAIRDRAFNAATEQLKLLQLFEDRLDRAQVLAGRARDHYPVECRSILKEMIEESLAVERPGIERRRRQLLDLVYRMDPEAASSIASTTDADPIRARSRSELQNQVEDLKAADNIRDSKEDEEKNLPIVRLGQIAWSELGRLNATRATGRSAQANLDLLEAARDADLEDLYPIASYAIEATSARYERTNEGPEYLRAQLFAIAEACELAFTAAQVTNRPDTPPGGIEEVARHAMTSFVAAGGREDALAALSGWLATSKSTYVKICDPYFGPADLNLLEVIARVLPKADVYVLTSLKAAGFSSGRDVSDEFEKSWGRIPPQLRPSSCTVVATGIARSYLFGIHNRWLVLEDCGIDLGTSAGAIGADRSHILTYMDPRTRSKCELDVDEYLNMKQKFWKDERLVYRVFTLAND